MRWLLALLLLAPGSGLAASASDVARAIRENSFDPEECYRVRDLSIIKQDIKIYLNDGHLIFSKPVSGKRMAAVFVTDVEGGDAEVMLLPPNRAERVSLARYIGSPTLNEHFRSALFLFTGDDYEALREQMAANPANKKAPELAPLLGEEWTPVLRNLGSSYQTRLTLDLLGGPGRKPGLFAALLQGTERGNFDLVYDPESPEQIFAGQVVTRKDQTFFDTWTSFPARSSRQNPTREPADLVLSDYRIEATVTPDLTLNAVTRIKVQAAHDGMVTAAFDITPDMHVTEVTVDGQPAEVLQRESLRQNLSRGGNVLFLVVPPEPLRAGRPYEFTFHHTGKVIFEAGDRVFFVSARGNWYPSHGMPFATYDLKFRYPSDLSLVTAGEVLEDRTEGEWRVTRRRTPAPVRVAAFNLGNYAHERVERGGFVVDVYANQALERALQPKPVTMPVLPSLPARRMPDPLTTSVLTPPAPNPTERLRILASEVASAMEFMNLKFGPPALPHLTVAPIPGAFGQGFPGLIYLSTLSYLKSPERPSVNQAAALREIFFADVLQAHEVAHQWWGNRVMAGTYRDNWLMEALANYSALMYVEKSRGGESRVDAILDSYRDSLLEKNQAGETVDAAGPIVLGSRLENSLEPRAWQTITYGKGSWILQMLRRRLGDAPFLAMLAELARTYDRKEVSTEEFRLLAAKFLPPKAEDSKLENFFDQWVYGSGIPSLKLNYSVKGKAPDVKLVGTVTQTDVDEDFGALVPVEIQIARGRSVTQWVRAGSAPAQFTVALKAAPLKVTLDPKRAVLRR
jgi:hypothetical protein